MPDYVIQPALIIVDMQNCFVSSDGSFAKLGYDVTPYKRIIPRVKLAYRMAKELGMPVIFSKAVRERSGVDTFERTHKLLPSKRREVVEGMPLSSKGTGDEDIIPELTPEGDDLILEKRRDSAFQDTVLEIWLRSLKVDTLFFCGVDTSICVEASIRDAFNRGYDVILLEDATASLNEEFYRDTLAKVKEAFGFIMSTEETFKKIERVDEKFVLRI